MERDAQRREIQDGQVNVEAELEEFYDNTGKYGVQNPVAPGEPNRDRQAVSEPVPDTGHDTKQEHKREHNAANETPPRRTNP